MKKHKSSDYFHNRSRKAHARLMHSLAHLERPEFTQERAEWNRRYRRKHRAKP